MDVCLDFTRAVLFDKIDPSVTRQQALLAADKVCDIMKAIGGRSTVSVMVIGNRYHVGVLVEDPLLESKAPPETIDGVYVSIGRVNSLDGWLGPKTPQP